MTTLPLCAFIIIAKAEHSSQEMETFVKKKNPWFVPILIFITQAEHRYGNFPDNGMYLYPHKFRILFVYSSVVSDNGTYICPHKF